MLTFKHTLVTMCIYLHLIGAIEYTHHVTTTMNGRRNFILNKGDTIHSTSRSTKLTFQSMDGNLVLRFNQQTTGSSDVIFASNTNGYGAAYVELNANGNMLIKDYNNATIWETNTPGNCNGGSVPTFSPRPTMLPTHAPSIDTTNNPTKAMTLAPTATTYVKTTLITTQKHLSLTRTVHSPFYWIIIGAIPCVLVIGLCILSCCIWCKGHVAMDQRNSLDPADVLYPSIIPTSPHNTIQSPDFIMHTLVEDGEERDDLDPELLNNVEKFTTNDINAIVEVEPSLDGDHDQDVEQFVEMHVHHVDRMILGEGIPEDSEASEGELPRVTKNIDTSGNYKSRNVKTISNVHTSGEWM
eukprot:100840_1